MVAMFSTEKYDPNTPAQLYMYAIAEKDMVAEICEVEPGCVQMIIR